MAIYNIAIGLNNASMYHVASNDAEKTKMTVTNAINQSIARIHSECSNKALWISESHRQTTIRQWSGEFIANGLPIPK